jgi:hypothetical protein
VSLLVDLPVLVQSFRGWEQGRGRGVGHTAALQESGLHTFSGHAQANPHSMSEVTRVVRVH